MHFGAESPFRLKRKNADANHCLPIKLLVLASALAKLVAFNKIDFVRQDRLVFSPPQM